MMARIDRARRLAGGNGFSPLPLAGEGAGERVGVDDSGSISINLNHRALPTLRAALSNSGVATSGRGEKYDDNHFRRMT
ncbi:MAG: hypothetical protein FWH15_08910 [Betaproteobacteria bacterium]|nr:hypothetical protein [Betaproteobacteria bacterium]